MNRSNILLFIGFTLFLAGCGEEKMITDMENRTETISQAGIHGESQVEDGGQREEYPFFSWQVLENYADAETSVRNSNKLNLGKLWEGSDGRIYYIDEEKKAVVVSGPKGEELEILYEGEVSELQEANGYLYLHMDTGLWQMDCVTGEMQQLWQEPFGEFFVVQDKLYVNGAKGFCKMNVDGTDTEILLTVPEAVLWMPCGGYWLCNESAGADPTFFWEGHLLLFDETTGELTQLGEHLNYPLVIGNQIVIFNSETLSGHVWDLGTGEDTDLITYVQKAVGDGERLYYFVPRMEEDKTETLLIEWNGEEEKTLIILDGRTTGNLYIAHGHLYWQKIGTEGLEWWYYSIETEESGRL